jgi:hypothetical protein
MSLLRISTVVLASVLIPGLAGAITVKGDAAAASQPAAQAFATPDQLRECLDIQAALKLRLGAIEATNAVLEQKFNQLQADDMTLMESGANKQFEEGSGLALDATESPMKIHNQRVKQLNQDHAEAQRVSDAYNADLHAYHHQCSALVFSADDMDAVLKERKKAAAQASAASAP